MLGHWDAATVSAHAAYSRAGFVRGMMAQADLTFVLLDVKANKAAAIEGEVRDVLRGLIVPKEAFAA